MPIEIPTTIWFDCIIIADTKLEFGNEGDSITLIDELLTPDSSPKLPPEIVKKPRKIHRSAQETYK